MANDFGTAKSVFILAIVAGCFAILWPNVFYPMITGNYQQNIESHSSGCCDVIFDSDINGIKIITELCEKILNRGFMKNVSLVSFTQGKLSKDTINLCKKTVMEKCSLDITDLVSRSDGLGKDYKQTLELLRTLNSSICLRESFGISLGQIGLPRRMRVWGLNASKHMKPERPPHLHPEMMHPALREKGRAIQQSQKTPTAETKPTTIPGMRPTLGGAGHVVPPPKGGGTMGIVMPMYTIGIVIFFLYTMLKLMFKKSGDSRAYDDLSSDPDFQQDVFGLNQEYIKEKSDDTTRLGDTELEMLKERLQETEKAMERIVAKMMSLPNHSSPKEVQEVSKDKTAFPGSISQGKDDLTITQSPASKKEILTDKPIADVSQLEKENEFTEVSSNLEDEICETKAGVKVLGVELTESCEGGKWSKPETPRPPTPQNIYIPAVLPDQSKIIVTNSSTETITSTENNAPVVLSGKVTLSLIGIQESGILGDDSIEEIQPGGVLSKGIFKDAANSDLVTNIEQNKNEDSTLVTNG